MTFKKDLSLGKKAEREVINLLKNAGFSVSEVVKRGDLAYKDIEINGYSAEIKFDVFSFRTGNLCLEYFNPKKGKPSGISLTSALLYIYVLQDSPNLTVWIAPTKAIKEFMRLNKPWKHLTKVGDGNSSIYLYKLDHILPIFTRLDNLSPEKVKEVICSLFPLT